jgi:hypothetical protein
MSISDATKIHSADMISNAGLHREDRYERFGRLSRSRSVAFPNAKDLE